MISPHAKIHPSALVDKSCSIAPHVIVGPNCVIEAGVTIGEKSIIQGAVRIGKGCDIGFGCIIKWGAVLTERVWVGDNVLIGPYAVLLGGKADRTEEHGIAVCNDSYIGAGAKIAAGIKIKKPCIIGVNAFVNRDLDNPGVYGGTPAKYIKPLPET